MESICVNFLDQVQFLVRDVIYTSRAYLMMPVSVCLSVCPPVCDVCALWSQGAMDPTFDLSGGLGFYPPPHCLKMTSTLVTENFCLGGRLRPPPPVPIQHQFANYLCCFSLQHKFVAETVSSFRDLWVELWTYEFCVLLSHNETQKCPMINHTVTF